MLTLYVQKTVWYSVWWCWQRGYCHNAGVSIKPYELPFFFILLAWLGLLIARSEVIRAVLSKWATQSPNLGRIIISIPIASNGIWLRTLLLIHTSYHSWIVRLRSQGTRWFLLCELNVCHYRRRNTMKWTKVEGIVSFRNVHRPRLISEKRYYLCHDFDNPKYHLFKLC